MLGDPLDLLSALAREQEVPRTWDALGAYLARMYASGSIAVSAQARARNLSWNARQSA